MIEISKGQTDPVDDSLPNLIKLGVYVQKAIDRTLRLSWFG